MIENSERKIFQFEGWDLEIITVKSLRKFNFKALLMRNGLKQKILIHLLRLIQVALKSSIRRPGHF